MANENPFKGCASYEDGDQFYGRESEIREIESLIKNETLTLLFSRSGIGKSSIIKAGIFPALKNDYEFFPIYILFYTLQLVIHPCVLPNLQTYR